MIAWHLPPNYTPYYFFPFFLKFDSFIVCLVSLDEAISDVVSVFISGRRCKLHGTQTGVVFSLGKQFPRPSINLRLSFSFPELARLIFFHQNRLPSFESLSLLVHARYFHGQLAARCPTNLQSSGVCRLRRTPTPRCDFINNFSRSPIPAQLSTFIHVEDNRASPSPIDPRKWSTFDATIPPYSIRTRSSVSPARCRIFRAHFFDTRLH